MIQSRFDRNLLSGLVGFALLASPALMNVKSAQAQTAAPCSSTGTSSTNLAVCSASYLGGSGNDTGSAIEVAPNGTVVFGGTVIGNNFGKTPINLKAGSSTTTGGNGTVIRTSTDGKSILSVTRLGNAVEDLDVNRSNGKIAVAGDFGVALLSADAKSVLWSKGLGGGGGAVNSNGRRVAVGTGGHVAAMFNKTVTVFNESGSQLGQFKPSGTYIEDVAIDSSNGTVIVTGFSQKDGGGCSQLQVAFIRGYSYTGSLKWTNYDWTHAQAHGNKESCADTRGIRVSIGRDNKLYFVGESAGGNSIYRYSPRNLTQNAPNVSYDQYTSAYNMSAQHITYFSRMSLTGVIDKGQVALARNSEGKGATTRPKAIAADEAGNVYVGGVVASFLPNRNNLQISGKTIGAYKGGDGFLLVVSPDFKTRKTWTTWTGTTAQNKATVFGVAAAKGVAAVVSTTDGGLMTVNPVQGNRPGGFDAFFSVFPTLK